MVWSCIVSTFLLIASPIKHVTKYCRLRLLYIFLNENVCMIVQGKYAEALSVVEGELGNKVVHQPSNFLRLKRATYHTHLGQWQAAADVYRDLIKDE